jgi:hypothetical protein
MTTTTSHPALLDGFDGHGDVGEVQIPGDARVEDGRLAVTGSGHNMWLERDGFHFVWRAVDGDWTLSAAPRFRGDGVSAHRKAVLLVRASLDSDAVYAGIAVHGDGLTSLQFRTATGSLTEEIKFAAVAPASLTLRKVGDRIQALAGDEEHGVQLSLPGTYYLGLAVCSHVDDVAETVDFSEIELGRVERE